MAHMNKELVTLALVRLRQHVAHWPLDYEGEALCGENGLEHIEVASAELGQDNDMGPQAVLELVRQLASAPCLAQWAAISPSTGLSWDALVQSYEDFIHLYPDAEPYLRLSRQSPESLELRLLGYLTAQAGPLVQATP